MVATRIFPESVPEEAPDLIQANMDHWDSDPANDTQQFLVRCQLAESILQAAEKQRRCPEESDLWAILWKYPIFEKGITLYSSVINPAQGTFQSASQRYCRRSCWTI